MELKRTFYPTFSSHFYTVQTYFRFFEMLKYEMVGMCYVRLCESLEPMRCLWLLVVCLLVFFTSPLAKRITGLEPVSSRGPCRLLHRCKEATYIIPYPISNELLIHILILFTYYMALRLEFPYFKPILLSPPWACVKTLHAGPAF